MKKNRIAIFTNHQTQWESPFFGYLNRNTMFEVDVFYTSKLGFEELKESESGIKVCFDMPGLLEDYKYFFIDPDDSINNLIKNLRYSYDAFIIEGHHHKLVRKAIWFGFTHKIPMIYRSDSTLLYSSPFIKSILRKFLLPIFFKFFKAFLPLSTPASLFLNHYGVKDEKIFLTPYMLDNDWYNNLTTKWRTTSAQIKKELRLDEFKNIALAILRFEDRENPMEFLFAAEFLKTKIPSLGFVLIGDGTQQNQVKEFISSRNLNNVVLPGYLKLSELSKYYAIADVFIHPAKEECWGLSVNEAMASQVPVIVSTGLGCRFDLLPSEEYGFIYPTGDIAALTCLIEKLINNKDLSNKISRNAKLKIDEISFENTARMFEKALKFSIRTK